jgi:hypothetical protein
MNVKKFITPILLFLTVFLLTGCSLPFIGGKKQAALQVMSDPKATVFLDGNHLGQTPYFDEELKPGEYTLKLIPEEQEGKEWQKTVSLSPGVLTVASHKFAATDEESSGYLLNLEPISQKDQAKLSIVSIPDGAVVTVDGEPKGFTPLSLSEVGEGEHVINVATPGYEEKEIKAKTVQGYKLIVNVQLGRVLEQEDKAEDQEATPSAQLEDQEEEAAADEETEETTEETTGEEEEQPTRRRPIEEDNESTPSADRPERPYVKITETPTGWLNLREEPSTTSEDTIIKKLNPGEMYPFIEVNDAGWYKIEYQEGKQGWISGKYATLFR